uniref:tRNA pseudouridine synthase n=1 Tax=Myxobolus squamalis TaxID=59785 RepID=A0A6B2FYH2_MYXSQ
MLQQLLLIFKGTHDFYNFTANRSNNQKPLKRYILNFDIKEILLHDNIQFIVFSIQGQSFMLHQIRYMIGFTIMVMRGVIPIDEAKNVFSSRTCQLVKAPAVGLMLENIHYDYYNKKFKNDPGHPPIDWTPCQETALEFKKNIILTHIFDDEIKNNTTKNWILPRFDPQSKYWVGKFSNP